jgi:hypothetical protein
MLIEYRGKNENPPRQTRIFDKVVLLEGSNDVNPTEWQQAIAIPAIAAKVEALKLLAALEITSEENASKGLEEKTIPQAAKIIKDTFDIGLLKKWKDYEKREGVLKALEDQINRIENPTPAEKEAK